MPVKGDDYFFQHAVRSNYAGYDLLGKDYYDENRNGPVREELYLGLTKNYDNKGDYDNSDGSLIFVSDNPRIWGLLAGEGYVISQQDLIDKNDFRESDYREYYYLNYEGGKLEGLPKKCEVRFCADHAVGPDSGVPFRYPDWRRENEETRRLDEEERKVADARAEVRDYRGLEAEDPDTLLIMKTKAGPAGEYRVYGDRARVVAAVCGCPAEKRDLRFGICPVTARIREEDLDAAVRALRPVYRMRIVADGMTVAVLPRADEGYLRAARAEDASEAQASHGAPAPGTGAADHGGPYAGPDGRGDEPDDGPGDRDGGEDDYDDGDYDGGEDDEDHDDGDHDGGEDHDGGGDDVNGGNGGNGGAEEGKEGPDGVREDAAMLRVRGETALILRRMGIDVYSEDNLSPVRSVDVDPRASYAIRLSSWEAFTTSDDGKDYMYVLKNLEDAVVGYLEALGVRRDVLDVLRADSEETGAVFGDRVAENVSRFQTEELVKIFASRIADDGDGLTAAEREIGSRASDARVRDICLSLADRAEASSFARAALAGLGFDEGLEYGLTDEERKSAAELLEGPYGERMADGRPGTYEDYLSGSLGDALFSLSAAGDPRDRRAEVKERAARSYASFMSGLASEGTEETLRAYEVVTMTALLDAVEDNLLSDGAYRALSEEDDPLRGMFDEYTEKEYPSVATGEEAASFAEGYCSRFHPEIVDRSPAYADDSCPVYVGSRAEAAARGETAGYERSLSADIRCARDIGDALADGKPRPGAVEEICSRYGRERVEEVLLRHMAGLGWDRRLPRGETARAKALYGGAEEPGRVDFEADAGPLDVFLERFDALGRETEGGVFFGRALPGDVFPYLTEFETDENPFEGEASGAEKRRGAADGVEKPAAADLPAGAGTDPGKEDGASGGGEEADRDGGKAAQDAESAAAAGKDAPSPGGAGAGKPAEKKKTVWVPVLIDPGDVVTQDPGEDSIVVRLPEGGAYAGYRAWIKRRYVFEPEPWETERHGGPVVKVCLPDDRRVNLYLGGHERVTLDARGFAAAMDGKDAPAAGDGTPPYPERREREEFEVPDSSFRGERGGYVILRMPAGTYQGYTAGLRKEYVDRETRAGDGMLAVSMPASAVVSLSARRKEFSSMTMSAECLKGQMEGRPAEDFAYPEDTVPRDRGLNTPEVVTGLKKVIDETEARVAAGKETDAAVKEDEAAVKEDEAAVKEDEAAGKEEDAAGEETEAAAPAAPAADEVTVRVPGNACVMRYGGDAVYAMPKGVYRGYFFRCPDSRAEKAPDGDGSVLRFARGDPVPLTDVTRNTVNEVSAPYFASLFSGKGRGDWDGGFGVTFRDDDFYVSGKSLETLPEVMREKPNWVGVRVRKGEDGKRYGKLPVNPHNGEAARSDDPGTWGTLKEAIAFARSNGCAAVAYALDGRGGISCIDVDGCVDADGKRSALAEELISSLPAGAYVERSVSGTGIHVFGTSARFTDLRSFSRDGSMEFYRGSHFMTVTGNTVHPTDGRLVSFDEGRVADILSSRFDRRGDMRSYPGGCGIEGISVMDDREVLEKAFASRGGDEMLALYRGEDLKNNHSNSDMALMSRLAFWCNGDKEQMMRIFETSGLYRREKSPDYYECTAIKAIRTVRDRYTADRPARGPERGGPGETKEEKEAERCAERTL